MNGMIAEFVGVDLSESGIQPLGEQEMFGISGGISPLMAGFYLAAGAGGVLVAGIAAGVAIYYFTH